MHAEGRGVAISAAKPGDASSPGFGKAQARDVTLLNYPYPGMQHGSNKTRTTG